VIASTSTEDDVNNEYEDSLQAGGDEPSAREDISTKGMAWSVSETKFLITIMGEFLKDNDSESMPQSLVDLEKRIKNSKGKKKNLWKEFSEHLTIKFQRSFDPKQVSRKWQTLVDGYKKAIDNNKSTGKAPSKFAWLTEMNNLIGSRHDVNLVVTGTQSGIIIHRPDQIAISKPASNTDEMVNETDESPENFNSPECMPASTRGNCRKRKREEVKDDIDSLMNYFKESDERSLAIEEKILKELSDFNRNMQLMFEKMIDHL